MRKILITGGAGFIGTHLAERLVEDAHIVLFDNYRRNSLSLTPTLASHKNVQIVSGDIRDRDSLRGLFGGVETVIHLAAVAGVSSYYQEPLTTLKTNILGTVNVLEEAAKEHIKTFIYFSTSEVYGAHALWIDESAPYNIGPASDLRWVYAVSKAAGENFTLRYSEEHNFKCTVVRPFNIYGPRQVGEGAISNFCQAIADGKPMTIYGDGSAIRAWCYVADLVDAVCSIMQTPDSAGEILNIGNPAEVATTKDLAQRLRRLVPQAQMQFHKRNYSEVKARVPNIDKARSLLGFEPQVSLEDGLEHTMSWFMRNGRQ